MKILEAILILFLAVYTHCKPRHEVTFRRQPSNQTVLSGQSGTLECYVKPKNPHQKISIIWAKDGFINDVETMKKARVDPKTEGLGFVNFEHFSVEDDGEYNCQVRLWKSESAYINVLVPPKLDIVGSVDRKLLIAPGRNVRVTCRAVDGKPAAEIRWTFGGKDVTNQSRSTISEGTEAKLWTTTSVLELEINEKNKGDVRCYTVEHLILNSVEAHASVDLMYPPKQVKIREIAAAHDLVAGEEMTFTCDVTGGNPTPTITWEIDGLEVAGNEKIISSSHGGMITNQLVHILQSTNKEVTCVASNELQERVTDSFRRDVLYPPESTTLELEDLDPDGAVMEGNPWRLKCLVSPSNPKPAVRWLKKVRDGERLPIEVEEGDRIGITPFDGVRSYLTISQTKPEDNDVEFSCEVKISRTGFIRRIQASPIVKYAPGSVNVLAFDNNNKIPNVDNVFATTVENTFYLLCIVKGGYPAPSFIWSRNDVTLTGAAILDWDSSILGLNSDVADICDERKRNYCKVLKIDQIRASDNNARYKCEIEHEIETELFNATRLKVYFPPASLALSLPDNVVAGRKSSFTCTSSPSYPKAAITWFVDDEEITSPINNKWSKADENGGYNTTSIFKLTPSAALNGKNITCRARTFVDGEVEKIQVGTLNVQFKPVFRSDQFPAHVTAFEGDDVTVPIVVDANPSVSQYRWTTIAKYNTEKTLTNGKKLSWNETDGTLHLTSLTPHDNRIFQVRAENQHGSTSYNISLHVKYEAHIDHVTPQTVTLKESAAVVLKCKVRANPVDTLEITWQRENGEVLKKTRNSTENAFKIENVRVSDEGNFICTASNGIGNPHVEMSTLKIERKPRFDLAKTPKKFAITAYPGKRYGVPCVASGRPEVNFTWQDGHGRLIESSNDKYSIETRRLSETSFKSTLFIDESKTRELLKTEDDSSRVFVCIASNLQGEEDFSINVVEIGPPDCPQNVQIGNISSTSLSVSWKPEFNGGLKQSIWLRINPPPLNGTLGSDWKKMNKTSCQNRRFTIAGLQPGTSYNVNVKANNTKGDSKEIKTIPASTKENYATKTSVSPPGLGDFNSLLWIMATVGGVLIIIITVCVVFFCRRGKTINEEDEKKNIRMHSFPIIHPSFESNAKSDEENGNEEGNKRQSRIESPVQSSNGNWKKTAAASSIGNFPEMRRTLSAHSFALPASAAPSAECSEMMPTRGEDLSGWERNRNVCDYLNSVRGFNTMRSYKSPALDGFYPKHLEQTFNYSMAPPNGGGHSSQHSPPVMCMVDDGANHAAARQPLLRQQSDVSGHHSAASAGYVTSHDRIAPLVTQYRESKRCSFGHGGAQAARTTPNDDVMYAPNMISPADNGLYVIGSGGNEDYHGNQDDVEAPIPPPPPAVLISRGWNQRSSGGAGGHRMSCTEGTSSPWQQQQQHPQEQRWSMTHQSRSTTSGGSDYDFRSHSVTSNSTASSTRALLSNVRGQKREGPSPPLRFRDRPRVVHDEEELETRREFFLRCVNNDLAEEEEEGGGGGGGESPGLNFLV